jgi:phosphohistidine swiveling domain-containing protein
MSYTRIITLATGSGVGMRSASGTCHILADASAFASIKSGEIVVLPRPDSELVSYIDRVAGIVCNSGGVTCHLAQIALEFNIPFLVVAVYLHPIVEGDILIIDPVSGLLQKYE